MTKNEIMDYVTETPYNINKNILGQKLDQYANQSGGGASIDVTASVGQTIVVEEVDGSGKPTKWKAADFQEKICGRESAEILPETTFEIDEESGGGLLPDLNIQGGDKVIATYNGVEYALTVAEIAGNMFMGNAGAFVDGLPITDDPFVIAYMEVSEDENGNGVYSWIIATLDGSTSVTLSIKLDKYTPIPVEYMPKEYMSKRCVEINVSSDDFDHVTTGSWSGDKTLDTTEIMNALANGSQIYINFAGAMAVKRFPVVNTEVYGRIGKFDSLADLIKAHEMANMLSDVPMALYFTDPYHDDAYILFINGDDE